MRELTDRAFVDEWFRFFHPHKGLTLLGWCVAAMVYAPPDVDRRWLLTKSPGAFSTRYERVADLERFSAHLRALGYDLGEDDRVPLARVVELAAAH